MCTNAIRRSTYFPHTILFHDENFPRHRWKSRSHFALKAFNLSSAHSSVQRERFKRTKSDIKKNTHYLLSLPIYLLKMDEFLFLHPLPRPHVSLKGFIQNWPKNLRNVLFKSFLYILQWRVWFTKIFYIADVQINLHRTEII